MQLVGAGLCSARQDTPNYRKSSANPYALTRLAVEADAGHSRSRRRSVTDVGLPLAGTHRPGRMHRFYGNLRRICNFSMGRQSRRPLQHPFALSVGADDSVRPRKEPPKCANLRRIRGCPRANRVVRPYERPGENAKISGTGRISGWDFPYGMGEVLLL